MDRFLIGLVLSFLLFGLTHGKFLHNDENYQISENEELNDHNINEYYLHDLTNDDNPNDNESEEKKIQFLQFLEVREKRETKDNELEGSGNDDKEPEKPVDIPNQNNEPVNSSNTVESNPKEIEDNTDTSKPRNSTVEHSNQINVSTTALSTENSNTKEIKSDLDSLKTTTENSVLTTENVTEQITSSTEESTTEISNQNNLAPNSSNTIGSGNKENDTDSLKKLASTENALTIFADKNKQEISSTEKIQETSTTPSIPPKTKISNSTVDVHEATEKKSTTPNTNEAYKNQTELLEDNPQKDSNHNDANKKPTFQTQSLSAKKADNTDKVGTDKDAKETEGEAGKVDESKSKTAESKSNNVLLFLFIGVAVVGAMAFTYNFIKKRRQRQYEINSLENGTNGTENKPESNDREMKPLMSVKENDTTSEKQTDLDTENINETKKPKLENNVDGSNKITNSSNHEPALNVEAR